MARYQRHQQRRNHRGRRNNNHYRRRQETRPARDYSVVRTIEEGYTVNTSPEVNVEYFPALFTAFPQLAENIDWVSLRGAEVPTPPKRLTKTQHLYGDNYVYIKEESLDFHTLPESTAKKLEFILGDPEIYDAKKFVVSGGVGDPYCLAVAKIAREFGKKCEVIVRKKSFNTDDLRALTAMMSLGARVRLRETERWFDFTMKWKSFLSRFFSQRILPEGGASPEGVLGYVSSAVEIFSHIENEEIPELDYIFVPVITGTALAGLELGRRMMSMDKVKIIGIATKSETENIRADAAELAQAAYDEILKENIPGSPAVTFRPEDFEVITRYNGPEMLPGGAHRWLMEFLEVESLDLDLEYAGRAFFGMCDTIDSRKFSNKKILFWSTYSPFRHGDLGIYDGFQNLPRKLKRWIEGEQKEKRLLEVGKVA